MTDDVEAAPLQSDRRPRTRRRRPTCHPTARRPVSARPPVRHGPPHAPLREARVAPGQGPDAQQGPPGRRRRGSRLPRQPRRPRAGLHPGPRPARRPRVRARRPTARPRRPPPGPAADAPRGGRPRGRPPRRRHPDGRRDRGLDRPAGPAAHRPRAARGRTRRGGRRRDRVARDDVGRRHGEGRDRLGARSRGRRLHGERGNETTRPRRASCSHSTQRVPSHQRCQVDPSVPAANTSSRSAPHELAAGATRAPAIRPAIPMRASSCRPSSGPTTPHRRTPRTLPSGRRPTPSLRARRPGSRRATPAHATRPSNARCQRTRPASTQNRSMRSGPQETAATSCMRSSTPVVDRPYAVRRSRRDAASQAASLTVYDASLNRRRATAAARRPRPGRGSALGARAG